jgi:hypothetical protein
VSYRVTQRFLASTLIASLKRRGLIPTSDEAFGDTDFYALIDEETRTYILPFLRRTREDFLLARADSTLQSGFGRYLLPARCAAESLKHVAQGPAFTPLRRLSSEDAHRGGGGYFVEDDSVVLVDTPTESGEALRFVYFYRPNLVVAEAACGRVTAFDATSNEVTVNAAPGTFTADEAYDFVKGTPGFRCHAINQAATDVTANVLTFDENLPIGLAVGDYVCLAGETPIPQIPAELHPLLAQRVTYVLSNALGPTKSRAALEQLAQMESALTALFHVRDDSPRYVVNFNSPGWARIRSRGWRL